MSVATPADAEQRLLVLAPTAKDARLTESILDHARLRSVCFTAFDALCAELASGAAAVLIPEEVLDDEHEKLAAWLGRQPPWSDLPILILARSGADSEAVARAMDMLGNVTVIERPIRVSALVSVIRSALRARQRQYQIRDYLLEREKTAARLVANDRRKDEFLAILAHELRNPLAPIRNSLYILRRIEGDNPELARISAMMERQVNHMVRLVDDLLEVSRITRDKIELRKERVAVASIVRAAVESSRPAIDAAGQRLDVEIADAGLVLDADPVRLAQVLANLLNNAARYSDPGGLIRLSVRRDGPCVEFSVRDTGMGIAADMLSSIFELFTQVHEGTSRSQGGLGIGLTLVKRLTELHGGTVRASSDGAGRGSEFIVRLPMAEDACQPAVAPAERAPASAAIGRRVLVVDDNVDAADSLGTLLELLGAETRVVYDGPAAIEACERFHPAVVLLDLGMPGMDGHEVARRIRAHPGAGDVTLIAMTGWGQESDRVRTREAGFDHHLIKPADVSMLETLLSSLGRAPDLRMSPG